MLRRRLLPHALFFFLLWPIGSALFAVLAIREQSVVKNATSDIVFAGTLVGAAHLIPEFLWCALLLTIVTVLLFGLLERLGGTRQNDPDRRSSRLASSLLLWAEPLLLTLAFAAGLALEYPAVLRHSLFRIARNATVLQATAGTLALVILLGILVGAYRGRVRGAVVHLVAFALFVLAGWALPFVPLPGQRAEAHANGVVLFGIDSLSQREDVSTLRRMTRERGGVWYQAAVTPALVTNAVWASILMQRLPSASGVFLIYQDADWKRAPYSLVAEAERRGFETWSFFSSQFTSYLGSHGGFDRDRSSPVGWLYIATGFVKDSSIFLPVLLPRLPQLPFATSPANQEGTFAYDLQQNVRDVLTAGGEKPAFVAAHLDYLHAYGYPRYGIMTPAAAARVRAARVDALQDQSLDPDLPHVEGDPLSLQEWKKRRIQEVVVDELRRTKFLEKGNKLVILSDHGPRQGMGGSNFGNPLYFHVVLATFGVPGRDPRQPISLADIPALIGMPAPDVKAPVPPLVQHEAIQQIEGAVLQNSISTGKRGAGLKADGRVVLDPLVVRSVGRRLTTYVPFGPRRGYWRTLPDGRVIPADKYPM